MGTIVLPKAESEVVLNIIIKIIGKCTVYVFGYREHHFDILIISKASVTGSHLMNELAERTNNDMTALVLLHHPTQLKTTQLSQEYFFDQVLRNGQRINLDKENVPYLLHHNPERDLEADTRYWNKCIAVAQFNLQAVNDSTQVDVVLCKIALLNQSCVQIALGLIRVFLGYTPNEYGLKYLLQLCGHFTDLPQRLFNRTTDNGMRLYKMLCTPAGMLLHWTRLNADESDFAILFERTQIFFDRAGEQANNELNRLTTLKTIS